MKEGIERTKTLDRKKAPRRENKKKRSNRIALPLKYNRTLPNLRTAITNNWNLLHINQEFKEVFQEASTSILAFSRNRNLYDLLEDARIL